MQKACDFEMTSITMRSPHPRRVVLKAHNEEKVY